MNKSTMKLLAIVASLIAALPVRGESGDDTLKYLLSKSDLVVIGTITSEPIGINDELGAPNYICDFRVQDVLKGDDKLKDQAIKVNITHFEMDPKDKHPLIKKDGECILFLKRQAPNVPTWSTADFWFGVQHPSPWMARSLKRLVADPILKVGESTEAPKDGFANFEEMKRWSETSSFGGGRADKLKMAGTDVFYSDRMFTSGRATSELRFYTEGAAGHLREFLMVPTQLKEFQIITENDQILVKCYDSKTKNWMVAMTIAKWMLPR